MISNDSYDPAAFLGAVRRAFDPMIRVHQESLSVMERLARLQLDTARDCVESSLAHARALVEAGSPAEFFRRESELTARLGQRLQDRTREFLELQADSGRALGQAMGTAASGAADAAQRTGHEAQHVIRSASEAGRRGSESLKRPS